MKTTLKKAINNWSQLFSPENVSRWLILGIFIGVLSGLTAVGFFYLLQLGKHFTMHVLAGFASPAPEGERILESSTNLHFHQWIFFLLPVVAGLLSGLIVYRFAPEAEGHGTDAMIDAFHNKKGIIRGRVPLIKGIATLLTLSGGGSAGREGPIAQIGAGIGSKIATLLGLSDKERRILLLANCGGGLSAIFRAPLGGALTSIEVLYRRDFETEALIPTIISSITAYIIFTVFFGSQPIFYFLNYTFSNPKELIFYLLLGMICIPIGVFYVKIFYGMKTLFDSFQIPRCFKPMLGGLGVGIIGLLYPQVYGDGWGWIQLAILGKLVIGIMVLLIFMKIFATSFTISSGGSGGVFGPTLFIGGMIGGMVGFIAHHFYPAIVSHPGAFVVVGMASFFAGVAHAPIGSLLMCSEMTQGYGLIAPLMLVSFMAILFNKKYSIYQKQVESRLQSPAHVGDFTINVLAEMKVKEIYKPKNIHPISKKAPYGELKKVFAESTERCFPVSDEKGELIGCINWQHARPIVFEVGLEQLLIAEDLMIPAETLAPENNLYEALLKFLKTNQEELLVVNSEEKPNQVLGVLRHDDLSQAYNQEIMRRKSEQ
ncbi:MAG: chloride channel protein [Thermodesulfobacteriota bacterium]|nr:MAG: chloride channel protein [Thermodesulfobacteriota bacterium]